MSLLVLACQKEIDTFTAKHKLEARYVTSDGEGIPYHVPL